MNWQTIEKPSHPLENAAWVRVKVRIRDNQTGEIRDLEDDEILEDGNDAPSDYPWSEGNNGCDCNRYILFRRAGNEEVGKRECGEGLYSVQLINPVTGDVFYDEFEL